MKTKQSDHIASVVRKNADLISKLGSDEAISSFWRGLVGAVFGVDIPPNDPAIDIDWVKLDPALDGIDPLYVEAGLLYHGFGLSMQGAAIRALTQTSEQTVRRRIAALYRKLGDVNRMRRIYSLLTGNHALRQGPLVREVARKQLGQALEVWKAAMDVRQAQAMVEVATDNPLLFMKSTGNPRVDNELADEVVQRYQQELTDAQAALGRLIVQRNVDLMS